MADMESKIRRTLVLVREALGALEADPELFGEAVKRAAAAARRPMVVPAEHPEVTLRRIERVLAGALKRLEG